MTLEEFYRMYPNGLVDAKINRIVLDYVNRVANLTLTLRGNPPESPNKDEYRTGMLQLNGFYYFVIESPDADHLSDSRSSPQVDGDAEDGSGFPLFEYLKPKLPTNAFCCRFYVHNWNSFIHTAAPDAEFRWL